jgi:hypothetical protein
MAFKHSADAAMNWSKLFSRCFGQLCPVGNFASWEEAVAGDLSLLIEAPVPSPQGYTYWLRGHIREHQIIPYVLDAAVRANPQAKLEGFTHADAVLVNRSNGFAVVFESKVLSDISVEVTFDCMRNQIARIVDVMLEEPDRREHPSDASSQRKPELSCFALLTPRLFQRSPWSRLYGRVIQEYQREPEALARDLPPPLQN